VKRVTSFKPQEGIGFQNRGKHSFSTSRNSMWGGPVTGERTGPKDGARGLLRQMAAQSLEEPHLSSSARLRCHRPRDRSDACRTVPLLHGSKRLKGMFRLVLLAGGKETPEDSRASHTHLQTGSSLRARVPEAVPFKKKTVMQVKMV